MIVLFSDDHFQVRFEEHSRILLMTFIGDIDDDTYKSYWHEAFRHATDLTIKRVVIDQSQIGNVSFNARGWAAVKMFPQIKKQLPKDLAGAIISSGKLAQKSGVQYLVKTFRALTGYKVEFHPDEASALEWLKGPNDKVLKS